MARYVIVPGRSKVWIEGRSSVHPIHTETDGLEGWLELDVSDGGAVDLGAAPAGHLEFEVDRLKSPNPLESRELKRRIEARKHPTIQGDLVAMTAGGAAGTYTIEGDLTFMGTTRRYTDSMTVARVDASTVQLAGQATFDVRDFGMQPPKILMLKVEPEVAVRVEIVARAE